MWNCKATPFALNFGTADVPKELVLVTRKVPAEMVIALAPKLFEPPRMSIPEPFFVQVAPMTAELMVASTFVVMVALLGRETVPPVKV